MHLLGQLSNPPEGLQGLVRTGADEWRDLQLACSLRGGNRNDIIQVGSVKPDSRTPTGLPDADGKSAARHDVLHAAVLLLLRDD